MDVQGRELNAADIWSIFEGEYRLAAGDIDRLAISEQADGQVSLSATVRVDGVALPVQGQGAGPVQAFVNAIAQATGVSVSVLDYHEHAIGSGAQARAAAYLEMRIGDTGTLFGVGIDANIVTASMKAVLSGLLRCGVTIQAAALAE